MNSTTGPELLVVRRISRRRIMGFGALLAVIAIAMMMFGGRAYNRLFLVQVDSASLKRTQATVSVVVGEVAGLGDATSAGEPTIRIERECLIDSGQILRQPGLLAKWKAEDPTSVANMLVVELKLNGWEDHGPGSGYSTFRSLGRVRNGTSLSAGLAVVGPTVQLVITPTNESPCSPGLITSDD